MERRTFVKNTALASAGFAILPTGSLFAEPKVKIGIIGVGLRGQNHLELALRRKDVDVVAICDIDDQMLQRSADIIKRFNKPAAKIFTGDQYAWRKLLEIKEIDGIIIATPGNGMRRCVLKVWGQANMLVPKFASVLPWKIIGMS